MQVKKQQLELDMEQHTGSNRLIPKEYVLLGSILSPCLFNLDAEYIMRNAGLREAQAGIKIVREMSITTDMQMTPSLWQKAKKK